MNLEFRFHFNPPSGWMNDPNGPIYVDGIWHLFHQWSISEPDFRSVGWGHASSADLLHWDHHGFALPPMGVWNMYSGMVVEDEEGLAGVGKGGLLAFHTVSGWMEGERRQRQELAYSGDRGRSWRRWKDNPLIDEELREFRDPFVFRRPDGTWILLVAKPIGWNASSPDERSRLVLYSSSNLIEWRPSGEVLLLGEPFVLFECPAIMPITDPTGQDRLVLLVSCVDRSQGDVGCRTLWTLVHWYGEDVVVEHPLRPVDHGPDLYAAIPIRDAPEGPIILGWMSSWSYARRLPFQTWRGGPMSLPRRVKLLERNGRIDLAQEPGAPIEGLRGSPHAIVAAPVVGTLSLGRTGPRFEIVVTLQLGDADEVGVRLRADDRYSTSVGLDREGVFLDRRWSGPAELPAEFPMRAKAPLDVGDRPVDLRIIADGCTLEVFADGGRAVLSALFFPEDEQEELLLFADGQSAQCLGGAVWTLDRV